MFLAYSTPKEPCTLVSENNSAVSFPGDVHLNYYTIITMITYNINLYRPQEEYYPNDDTTQTVEEEQAEGAFRKRKKLLFFVSCLLELFQQCCSCGQEVELNTPFRGTLLVVQCIRRQVMECLHPAATSQLGKNNY